MSRGTKAVILAAGLGTRMRKTDAAAKTCLKALTPIGRPFLGYVLSVCADAGITDVCLVIRPEHAVLRSYYGEAVDANGCGSTLRSSRWRSAPPMRCVRRKHSRMVSSS